jgi:hypothetical protein
MADGLTISAEGLTEADKRMQERVARLADLSPALRVVAAEIETQTSNAFQRSQSPFGEQWPALAPSTQAARAAKLPGANRRSKSTGKLTRAAYLKREKAVADYQAGKSGIFKPLIDTGRMRNSVHVNVRGNELEFTAVGYMAPHITGSLTKPGRPPKRNPTVFQMVGGAFQPIPNVLSLLLKTVGRYVATGRVT